MSNHGLYPEQTPVDGSPPVIPNKTEDERSAVDFVLWLNGAFDVLDATPPSQAQWEVMRQKIAAQVGEIVSNRIRRASAPGPTTP